MRRPFRVSPEVKTDFLGHGSSSHDDQCLYVWDSSKVSEVTVDHLTDSLPTVICVSDRLVPGSVLQGCCFKR